MDLASNQQAINDLMVGKDISFKEWSERHRLAPVLKAIHWNTIDFLNTGPSEKAIQFLFEGPKGCPIRIVQLILNEYIYYKTQGKVLPLYPNFLE